MAVHARNPQELHQLWMSFYRAQNLEGLISLYEPGAVIITPDGGRAKGKAAITELYRRVLADDLALENAKPLPAVANGDLAITAMRLSDGAMTCEVARLQGNGTWLWAIDVPNFIQAA